MALAVVILTQVVCGCGPKTSSEATSEVRGSPIQAAAAPNRPPAAAARREPVQQATASFAVPSTNAFAAAVAPIAASADRSEDTGYSAAGFDKLAGYAFEISDELLGPVTNDVSAVAAKTNARIPEPVRAFNQKRAAIKGFMLPLKVEGGLVTELLIMKDQSMCCYGTTPKINEWVSVKMNDKGVKPLMDQPVTLLGTLHVGEMRENGYLIGIYRMDGEKMQGPEN